MNGDSLFGGNANSMTHNGAISRTNASEYLPDNYKEVIEEIKKGFRVVVILRGLPGSGSQQLEVAQSVFLIFFFSF